MKKLLLGVLVLGFASLPAMAQSAGAGGGQGSGQAAASRDKLRAQGRPRAGNKCRLRLIRWRHM